MVQGAKLFNLSIAKAGSTVTKLKPSIEKPKFVWGYGPFDSSLATPLEDLPHGTWTQCL